MDNLYEFTSEDTFEIKDRGVVFSFGPEQIPEELFDPRQMLNSWVVINGRKEYVVGVETFCVHRDKDHPYRMNFGLLIAPQNEVKSVQQS